MLVLDERMTHSAARTSRACIVCVMSLSPARLMCLRFSWKTHRDVGVVHPFVLVVRIDVQVHGQHDSGVDGQGRV